MRMTLDLQPAETHRYTIHVDGSESIPISVCDEDSDHHIETSFRGVAVTLDRTNSFHLHFPWTDGTNWDVVLPSKPRPAAVIQQDGERMATAEFRLFRTWQVSCQGTYQGTLSLKSRLFWERVIDQGGRQLATSWAAPWAVRIPIDIADDVDERMAGLIAAVFLLAVAYRHLVDGD